MQPLWKRVWQVPKKLNRELPYALTIPLLATSIYPREVKTFVHPKMCTGRFTTVNFAKSFTVLGKEI